MGTQDDDLLDYFGDEQDRAEANTPSIDNLFSNRDVLERRLRCRLDREDLVVRGILPANHAAPNILAQIHQLERAKTGDILQRKIRVRSSRQQLVQRHILADSKIDASLQGKQTSLERHRIADSLNEQLFNRPGPLELIRENILEVEPKFADAVKQGCVPFHPTCRDVSTSPVSCINIDSPLSEVEGSRCSLDSLSPLAQDSMDTFSQAFTDHVKVDNVSTKSSDSIFASNISSAMSELEDCIISASEVSSRDSSKYDRSKETSIRKQSKSNKKKLQNQNKQKVKKYKYHEYKPPGSVPATYQAPLDDRYKRLLEQQQMFLQLQVMKQNALFAAFSGGTEQPVEDPMEMEEKPANESEGTAPSATLSIPPVHSSNSLLDDLRVTELKAALRMRGLPVSGSKSRLLERLKSYEDKRRTDCEEKSADNLTPVSCVTTSAANETSPPLQDTISPNSCANTFIKVTTYASQNGETFQLVQAVPNLPTSDIQYHLMPSSVVLGTAQSNIQQFPIQHLGIQTAPQTTHVVQVPAAHQLDGSLLSSITGSSATQNRRDSLSQIIEQSLNQPINQTLHTNQPCQNHVTQQTANSVAGSSALDIFTALEQNQPIDSVTLQMLSSQIQQVAKLQASFHTNTLERGKESENGNNSSLLRQLHQLKQQNTSREASCQSIFNSDGLKKSFSDDSHHCPTTTYQWDIRNGVQEQNHLQSKPSLFDNHNSNFRSRSLTDPSRSPNSSCSITTKKQFSPAENTLHCSDSFQDFNQNVGLNSKWNGNDLRAFSLPNGIPDVSTKSDSRASDDLMDILGELSNSASALGVNFAGPETHSPVMIDTHRKFQSDLESSIQVKEESAQTPASIQSKTLSPGTLKSHRPYGSFPGDLNTLGVALNDSNFPGCLRDSSNRTPCSTKSAQDLQLNSMPIGDIEMDSEASYFSHPNEVEWLNLTTFPNMHSFVDKQANKLHHESNDTEPIDYRESLHMDVLSTNLFESSKTQDPLSIFDIDGGHSLMAVDSNEPDKWDL